MEFIRWIHVLVLFHSCGCAVLNVEEELKPLELPDDYEQKMKTLLPQLMNQVGIPAALIPSGNGLLASSWSRLSGGLDYLKFWGDSKQEACKSKLTSGQPKVTKYGRMMCRKYCQEENENRLNFLRNTLETITEGSEEIVADVKVEDNKKFFECISNGQGFDCVCMKNEVLRVSPSIQALMYQIFGSNRTRDVVPDFSLKKILFLLLLYLAEKSINIAASPVLVPLKMLYHMIKKID